MKEDPGWDEGGGTRGQSTVSPSMERGDRAPSHFGVERGDRALFH